MSLVMVVLNIVSNIHKNNIVLTILIAILSIIWSYTWFSIALASIDGKMDILNFKSIKLHFPTITNLFAFIAISIFTGIAFIFGAFLLILPGIYLAIKFSMAKFSYVDRQEGIRKSLRHSWNIVKGDIFWTVLLTMLVAGMVFLVGFVLFGVGIAVTYPMCIFIIAQLYRAVNKHYMESQNLTEQPIEISTT